MKLCTVTVFNTINFSATILFYCSRTAAENKAFSGYNIQDCYLSDLKERETQNHKFNFKILYPRKKCN